MAGTKSIEMMEKLQCVTRRVTDVVEVAELVPTQVWGPEWIGLYSQARNGTGGGGVSSVFYGLTKASSLLRVPCCHLVDRHALLWSETPGLEL